MQSRPMILMRIIFIFTLVPEGRQLGSVDTFVVVKGTVAKIMGSQHQCASEC